MIGDAPFSRSTTRGIELFTSTPLYPHVYERGTSFVKPLYLRNQIEEPDSLGAKRKLLEFSWKRIFRNSYPSTDYTFDSTSAWIVGLDNECTVPLIKEESLNGFLKKMRTDKDYSWCDLEIHLKDRTEKVHTILAASKSKKLASDLRDLHPLSIDMKEFSAPIVSSVIDWMYFGEISVDNNEMEEYFKVASHLGLDSLKLQLENLLTERVFSSSTFELTSENTIEAMNMATNKKCDVSWKTMELMIVMFIGMFYELPVDNIKHLTPNTISTLLASKVSKEFKKSLINIAIDWFRVPENLTHLNGVIGCLTVDGMTSTDLAGFRKSLIEAILHDKDRKKIVVDARNGKLSINMDSKETFRSLCQAKIKAEAEADAEAIANGTKPREVEVDCYFGESSIASTKTSELVSNAAFFSYGDRSAAYFKYEEKRVLYKIPEKKVATPDKLKNSEGSRSFVSSKSPNYSMKSIGPAETFRSDSKKPAGNKKRDTEKKTRSSNQWISEPASSAEKKEKNSKHEPIVAPRKPVGRCCTIM